MSAADVHVVWLLWYTNDDCEREVLGVYRTRTAAEAALAAIPVTIEYQRWRKRGERYAIPVAAHPVGATGYPTRRAAAAAAQAIDWSRTLYITEHEVIG